MLPLLLQYCYDKNVESSVIKVSVGDAMETFNNMSQTKHPIARRKSRVTALDAGLNFKQVFAGNVAL